MTDLTVWQGSLELPHAGIRGDFSAKLAGGPVAARLCYRRGGRETWRQGGRKTAGEAGRRGQS